MRIKSVLAALICLTTVGAVAADRQNIPTNIAHSVAGTLQHAENQFLAIAEAMPEEKYAFVPTSGNFQGARSFVEQVKHVACTNFAFFSEIEGKTPPENCEKGGPVPAKTKAELLRCLHDLFDNGNRVLLTLNANNAMDRVEGSYAAPNSRLGVAVAAVWHIADHYGQIVQYLRMNGIVPASTQKYGMTVR